MGSVPLIEGDSGGVNSCVMKKYILFTDGGSRGNPGPGAIGGVVFDVTGKDILQTISEAIGYTTNNQAEYRALLAGLKMCRTLQADEVECRLDSQLVVKQMRHEYKVKDRDLAPLFVEAMNLCQSFSKVTFIHIPREQNKQADALVNQALDRV